MAVVLGRSDDWLVWNDQGGQYDVDVDVSEDWSEAEIVAGTDW